MNRLGLHDTDRACLERDTKPAERDCRTSHSQGDAVPMNLPTLRATDRAGHQTKDR